MKRMILIPAMIIWMFLSGCTVYHEVTLQNLLNQKITQVEKETVNSADHHKKFYSYFISPEIGRMEGDSTGNIFNYQGTEFLMNLNVSSVINEKYYNGIENNQDLLNRSSRRAYASGTYQDTNGDVHDFSVAVYDLGRQNYLTAMRTDTVDFCAVSDALKSVDLAGEMLRIARSVLVNSDAVTTAYSRKETVTFTGEKIQLFDSIAPESGRVEELFEDNDAEGNTESHSEPEKSSPSASPSSH